jgi:hypothetical protein
MEKLNPFHSGLSAFAKKFQAQESNHVIDSCVSKIFFIMVIFDPRSMSSDAPLRTIFYKAEPLFNHPIIQGPLS